MWLAARRHERERARLGGVASELGQRGLERACGGGAREQGAHLAVAHGRVGAPARARSGVSHAELRAYNYNYNNNYYYYYYTFILY
jgi:hypothetical protein